MSPLIQSFVLHFGEMGSRWGINRTVGQIYALLYVSEKPLNADEIAEELAFSRSNVSIGLKELQAWRLVKLQHFPGDRREYFSTPEDIWAIFRLLAEERQKREVEPTLTMLRGALMESPANAAERHAQARMQAMYDLIELITSWFAEIQKLDAETLQRLMKLGSRVQKLLQITQSLARFTHRDGGDKEAKAESRAARPDDDEPGTGGNEGEAR
ncbi:MarR family transcriptional regulator [Azoarcus indigens]|uniref:ArsR family transcriptional regulator n=1 Tax=Azoarcus indigens TaxID=29545 RepID=A0A4R6E8K2_9RHOO|nr:GbsR/MarR family transcriptional regulator [Azoarcus indigens]NMG66032.1 MarR family transcriptional regulator [Azoarcus indigens]TDN53348.1 ArsR family transcriptional regulator [Azoarcus indigens]